MEITGELILASNLLITVSLLVTTIYRAKIERDQIRIIIKNAKAAEKIVRLREILKKEKSLVEGASKKEIVELLESIVDED